MANAGGSGIENTICPKPLGVHQASVSVDDPGTPIPVPQVGLGALPDPTGIAKEESLPPNQKTNLGGGIPGSFPSLSELLRGKRSLSHSTP